MERQICDCDGLFLLKKKKTKQKQQKISVYTLKNSNIQS